MTNRSRPRATEHVVSIAEILMSLTIRGCPEGILVSRAYLVVRRLVGCFFSLCSVMQSEQSPSTPQSLQAGSMLLASRSCVQWSQMDMTSSHTRDLHGLTVLLPAMI